LKTLLLLKVPLLSTLLVFSIAVLAQISVRPGIILMLLLDSILTSKVKRAGQVVAARLVQNSPLAEGFTSQTGNTIVGRTIELNATADSAGATTAFRFDDCRGHRPSRNQRPHVAVSGATKSGWASTAEDGELTAYKEHSLILLCSRSVHFSKNALAVQASQSRQGDCTPQETAIADPIVGGSVAVAEHLLRRFLTYHSTA
jgi:hypothetical protein